MNIFRSMNISGSALTAQRMRMDIISENLANATTTRTEDGSPYRRKTVVMQERTQPAFSGIYKDAVSKQMGVSQSAPGGVRVTDIVEDPSPMKLVYDPGHPDADEDGYVSYPNVDTVQEMVDMMSATRSYEANVTALNAFKTIAMKALEIGR
ncbi:flagellar basal body rod protein FlgC [Oscillospiraceae bacterium OttesenSCG-928-F05]|nr:flagellar basal body rod protein FlgC [Oscillospiraceae bacterium OttesenSCG-928-F05]